MPESEGTHVEIVGLRQAFNDMQRWGRSLDEAIDLAAGPFARTVASQVSGKVPVLTGTLAASVDVEDEEAGAGVSIGDGVPYAGWIEFGGSRGRPLIPQGRYLYPTALDAEAEFARLAEEIAEQSVRSYPWSIPPLT